MMSTDARRSIGKPFAVFMAALALLLGALGLQHHRDAWPFTSEAAAAAVQPSHDMSSMATTGTADRVPIEVAPATLTELGVGVEEVRRESLTRTIDAVATIAPDESRVSHVHTRVAGWLEYLDVNTTGEVVRAGQPIARVFSQELLSSQSEYLAARQATAASGITSAVVAGGRTRLAVLGMTAAEITAIEESGQPRRLVTIVAPRGGVVVNRGVTAGTAVDPSMTLLTIADLSRVWVFAEVPEADIPAVRRGGTARLEFPGSGHAAFTARVDFVYPTLTERTRTLRVRFSVANAHSMLRPGLYGTAAFDVAGPPVVTVPRDAIVDTGRQQHVFVALNGRFEPRPVTLGARLADRVEIRSGLHNGDRIVSAGVFLLDSESRLRATGGMAGSHAHHARPGGESVSPPAVDPHAGHRE